MSMRDGVYGNGRGVTGQGPWSLLYACSVSGKAEFGRSRLGVLPLNATRLLLRVLPSARPLAAGDVQHTQSGV